jgi:hypothetical protein
VDLPRKRNQEWNKRRAEKRRRAQTGRAGGVNTGDCDKGAHDQQRDDGFRLQRGESGMKPEAMRANGDSSGSVQTHKQFPNCDIFPAATEKPKMGN